MNRMRKTYRNKAWHHIPGIQVRSRSTTKAAMTMAQHVFAVID
jgi:hypothetical protein